jgi:hypothetical protein
MRRERERGTEKGEGEGRDAIRREREKGREAVRSEWERSNEKVVGQR